MSPAITHRLFDSLTGKLVVILGCLILLGNAVFLYFSIRTDKKNLMENTVSFVSSLSEVTKRSMRYDMLTFNREDIQKTLEAIGESASIQSVRIFNRTGRTSYSSDKKEIGHDVDRASPACIGCHTDPQRPHDTLVSKGQWTIFRGPEGHRILSFVEPIYNEPDCYTSACHAHNKNQKVLGVLETDFCLQPIDMKIREQIIESSLYFLAYAVISIIILYYLLWRFVLRPITGLSNGMKEVTSGDLLRNVPVTSKDEVGRLTNTFNEMMGELQTTRRRMESWTQSLEEEVEKKAVEIRKTQGRLIQAEKLAALGRLTADIAHEIRNPLTALGGFGRRLQKHVADETDKEYADIVVSEVDRLEHILRDVMTFSRDARGHFERQSLTPIVEASLKTFGELCAEHSIRIEKTIYASLPVFVDAEQVRQAVNNLLSNAIDAMSGSGTLLVSTTQEVMNNVIFVAVHVSDSGPGIPEAELEFIFEPFHTTKEIGHGTGLGLSISRKIMEEHGGFIKAENRTRGGLSVSLYFPCQSDEDLQEKACWEFMECGMSQDTLNKCPAYPNFGRVCWVVAGTFCEGKVQGTFAQKCEDCRKCAFYTQVAKEAGRDS